MNKLQRRIRRASAKERNKSKQAVTKREDNNLMEVCFPDDSSDSGFDLDSRRRNSESSIIQDQSNDEGRDSSDDSIDSGIFGISRVVHELSSVDTCSSSDATMTVIEDNGLANLLCQSISINEDEPPTKYRRVENVEDSQVKLGNAISLYGIASHADRPQLTACRSSGTSKSSLTNASQNVHSKRKINRKAPSLHATYPNRAKEGQIDLRILSQPEEQHRARYMTEGSRGAIKDRRGSAFPTVKLFGYNQPVTLQVFIGSDQGKIQPHLFYQACKVSGKNCTPCSERTIDGTTVIEISMLPDKDMTVSCDCIGILKERNVDVEQRLPYFNMTRAKKKNTRCRIIFRVNLPVGESAVETLQTASSPILCTQPPGVPEICKKSIKECSVVGGTELFIIGKNFLKDTKIVFEDESSDSENDMSKLWQQIVEPEKEFLHQTHLVCRVPPYYENISQPTKVLLSVQSGGKTSEPHTFTYLPTKQGLDNYAGNLQAVPSGIPGTLEIGQQLNRSQLMPAFIQVTSSLTTPVPAVVVSQPSNLIAFPRTSVRDTLLKPPKLMPAPTKTFSKQPQEVGSNQNQIHVVVLQQTEKSNNVKKINHHLNRFKHEGFTGKKLHRLAQKGRMISTSKGKILNHPYKVNGTSQTALKQESIPPEVISLAQELVNNSVDMNSTILTVNPPQNLAPEMTTSSNLEMFVSSPNDQTQVNGLLQTSAVDNCAIIEPNMLPSIDINNTNNLLQEENIVMSQRNELLNNGIIINTSSDSSLSPPSEELTSNQISSNEINLAISQNELLNAGICPNIIDTKQTSDETPTILLQSEDPLKPGENLSVPLKTELLTPNNSPPLEQRFLPTTLHYQLPGKQIVSPDTGLTINTNFVTSSPLTRPMKIEPLLSQVTVSLPSPNPLQMSPTEVSSSTNCLQATATSLKNCNTKAEKTSEQAQCDMNMFQHTMTSALSMLSESDLLSLINPSTFDSGKTDCSSSTTCAFM